MNVPKIYREIFDMGDMTVQVHNEFHHTTTYLTVNGENDTVQAAEVDRVAGVLCGMPDCSCQAVPVVGDCVVDVEGNQWEIV